MIELGKRRDCDQVQLDLFEDTHPPERHRASMGSSASKRKPSTVGATRRKARPNALGDLSPRDLSPGQMSLVDMPTK